MVTIAIIVVICFGGFLLLTKKWDKDKTEGREASESSSKLGGILLIVGLLGVLVFFIGQCASDHSHSNSSDWFEESQHIRHT